MESQILARKSEVEKLIQDMKSANLESLTISPPEETKAFLDGRCQHTFHVHFFLLSKLSNFLAREILISSLFGQAAFVHYCLGKI